MRIRLRGEADEVKHSPCPVLTVHSSGGSVMILGLCELVRSIFSNLCAKSEVSWPPDWVSSGFFLPWWHTHIPRWQCQAHTVKEWVREHEAWFSNMDWPPQRADINPIENSCYLLTLHAACVRCLHYDLIIFSLNPLSSVSTPVPKKHPCTCEHTTKATNHILIPISILNRCDGKCVS